MTRIIGPIAMTWVPTPYVLPVGRGGSYRSSPLTCTGQYGGVPYMLSQDRLNPQIYYFTQFDETSYYDVKLTTGEAGVYYSAAIVDNALVMTTNIASGKGVKWTTWYMPQNVGGFPYLNLPDGVPYQVTRFDSSLKTVCFPEGGISCSTVAGYIFRAPRNWGSATRIVLSSGSGCPVTNNWGASYVKAYGRYSNDKTIDVSTSQGNGLGLDPVERQPGAQYLFNISAYGQYFQNGVYLENDLVATIEGPATDSANGRLLRIYQYQINFKSSYVEGVCYGNSVSISTQLVYELNLLSLLPNPSARYNYVGALICIRPGLLAISVGQDGLGPATEYLILIRYPGPVIIKYIIPTLVRQWWGYITNNNRLMIVRPEGTNFQPYYSADTVSLDYWIDVPARINVLSVNDTNKLEVISINRTF